MSYKLCPVKRKIGPGCPDFEIAALAPDDQLLAVAEALINLASKHPAQAAVVKLGFSV
jgi:hypothetical protein